MSREGRGYIPPEALSMGKAQEGENKILYPEKKTFDEKNNTLLLGVDKTSFDAGDVTALAEKNGFAEKDEFHITVLGFKNGAEIKKILKKISPEEREKKMSDIHALVESTDWGFIYGDERYRIQKEYPQDKNAEVPDQRETYIQLVQLPAIEEFYGKLNAILGTSLEAPPPHVTLFTKGTDEKKARAGIGINSESEFASLNPERV
jgi:hypothetical protein